jgi:L-rhamnose mutarotase
MIRKAFKMKLYPNMEAEYKERHNPIWEELSETLKNNGVHNYSIFFDDESNNLFGYAEIESESQWKNIADTEVCKKWWSYMNDIMETNPDNSPVSKELTSVFYLK